MSLITGRVRSSAVNPGRTARARSTKISTAAGSGQCAYWHQDFARDAEGLAARGDQPETGQSSDQRLGQGGRLVYHVLTVVEDDEERLPGQVTRR